MELCLPTLISITHFLVTDPDIIGGRNVLS
jgi:hypothetical protein